MSIGQLIFNLKSRIKTTVTGPGQKLDQIDKEVDAGMKSRTNKSQKPEEKMEQHETVENRFTGSYAGLFSLLSYRVKLCNIGM